MGTPKGSGWHVAFVVFCGKGSPLALLAVYILWYFAQSRRSLFYAGVGFTASDYSRGGGEVPRLWSYKLFLDWTWILILTMGSSILCCRFQTPLVVQSTAGRCKSMQGQRAPLPKLTATSIYVLVGMVEILTIIYILFATAIFRDSQWVRWRRSALDLHLGKIRDSMKPKPAQYAASSIGTNV